MPLMVIHSYRTDLPRYLIFNKGRRVDDMLDLDGFAWEDYVSFYFGCSFSWEEDLANNGLLSRNIAEGKNVSMFRTSVQCVAVGQWPSCPMVVSMRPIPVHLLQKAAFISAQYPSFHGAPVHIGDPLKIGITDACKPDHGDAVEIKQDEVPVFWACGVSASMAMEASSEYRLHTHTYMHT